jgi:AcrR family transcriptional regulator
MSVGVRATASRARRDKILEAALNLFLEKGLGATTGGDIIERSGASVGSFYHHFGGKADVAAALYLETLELYEQRFLAELRKHERARDGIEGAVRQHLRWTERNPKQASYLIHCREPEVAELSEDRAQQLNRIFFDEVLKWLGRRADKGEIRKLPPDVYYALWMGPANEFTRLWLLASNRDPQRITRAEALLASAAWEALRADTKLDARPAMRALTKSKRNLS